MTVLKVLLESKLLQRVVAVHVKLWPAPHDPLGQLVTAAPTQHHPSAVEANSMEESPDPGVLTHDGLVVRGEGLGPTDSALDARILQTWNSVHSSLNMHTKHVVVKLVQSEGKVSLKLLYEDRIHFISPHLQSVSLQLQVHRGVMVSDIGHVLNPRYLFRHHIGVLHGDQGDGEAHQVVDIIGPGSCAVHHALCLDGPLASHHTLHHLGPEAALGCENILHCAVLHHPGPCSGGEPGQSCAETVGVDGAV